MISDRSMQSKTECMFKELKDQRRFRSHKISQARSILEMNVTYTSMLLEKLGLLAISTLAAIAGITLAIDLKLTTTCLECFVRVMVQINLLLN